MLLAVTAFGKHLPILTMYRPERPGPIAHCWPCVDASLLRPFHRSIIRSCIAHSVMNAEQVVGVIGASDLEQPLAEYLGQVGGV